VIGVQWHPEHQDEMFAEQRKLFEAFGDCLEGIVNLRTMLRD
jgi:gamma-glutamyl-gamma-aminobutyrate hydrolase PuuD